MDPSKARITDIFNLNHTFLYLLESVRRSLSNKYPKRMFSQRITWGRQ